MDINILTLRPQFNKRFYFSILLSRPELGIMTYSPFEVEIGIFWLVISFGYQQYTKKELKDIANNWKEN
jgi:hypothetical protein